MTTPGQADPEVPSVEYGLIRAHVLASLGTLLISVAFGLVVATKFSVPEFLGGHAWLTWGRLRYNHTQGILFGWLGNAFLAFIYYARATPRQSAGLEPEAGMASFLDLELCGRAPWLGAGRGRLQPATRMGPSFRSWSTRSSSSPSS